MGHQLQTVIQGAVVLDIEERPAAAVCNLQQAGGLASGFSAAVDLQLHAKEAGALPVKEGGWFEVIAIDHIVRSVGAKTLLAVALIIIVVQVVHLIVGDQAAAVPAVSVVLPTSLAQGQPAFSIVIFAPDTIPASITQDCAAVPAGGTQVPAIKAAAVRQRMFLVTELADKSFTHRAAPPTKSSMGAKCSVYRSICSSVRLSKCSDSGGAPHRKKVPAITS